MAQSLDAMVCPAKKIQDVLKRILMREVGFLWVKKKNVMTCCVEKMRR
jgi:hypothetical protein